MELEKPICKKCLLQELQGEEEHRKLQEYIESIDADQKVPEDSYRDRLRRCMECEHLYQGICRKCGCFVEVRAVRKTGTCPHEEPKW